MGPRRSAMLLMLAASSAGAQPAAAPPTGPPTAAPTAAPTGPRSVSLDVAETASAKRIFLPPTLQWDNAMSSVRPAARQSAATLAALTGGISFGMSPAVLNAALSEAYPGVSWTGLALADEFPGEARMFGIPLASAGKLRVNLAACAGADSYVVFLFKTDGLFRISYRLVGDTTCADTDEAAQQIFARYVPIGREVAFSVRYRTGQTWVIDITDPTADDLMPVRWRQGAN